MKKLVLQITFIKIGLLFLLIILLSSCKVTAPQHSTCKNPKNCPHTNKMYYFNHSKNL
jgi:hypothetical protein